MTSQQIQDRVAELRRQGASLREAHATAHREAVDAQDAAWRKLDPGNR